MKHPSIEITIPVYNEEKRLTNGVRKLHAFCSENLETFHITIADNGSTDQTVELSNLLCSELGHLSLVQVDRKGVGRALKASWAKSNAEIIGYVDVDLSADLTHILEALKLFEDSNIAAVNGSRLLAKSKVKGRPLIRRISSYTFNLLLRTILQVELTDGMCGFKFIRKSVYDQLLRRGLNSDDWFFNAELIIKTEWSKQTVTEIPVVWLDDPNSKVKLFSLTIRYLREIARMNAERTNWLNS